MELKFETLEKQCKACADGFIDELKLLAILLNYYPDVRLKWMDEIGLMSSEIERIDKIADHYAKQKVEMENARKPQTREDVIKIENELIRQLFLGKLLRIHGVAKPAQIAEFVIRSQYRNCTILTHEHIAKLERLTLFSEHGKFPMHFLIFDADNLKIIGIEAVPA